MKPARGQGQHSRGRALAAHGLWQRPFHPDFTALWQAGRQQISRLLEREAEHRTPFLWLPVAFGLGIVVYFSLAREPQLHEGPLLAAIALVPALMDAGWRRALGITLLFAALGFSAATLRTATVQTPMLTRDLVVEVKGFVEASEPGRGRQRLLVRPMSISGLGAASVPHALRIGVPEAANLVPGDFIALRARLSPPSEAAMPGGYDFRRDAFFRSIGGVGYSLGKPRVEPAPVSAPWDLQLNAAIDRARNALTARIAKAIGGQEGALSAALITGKRGLISEATNTDLRASGLYHIVSISGLHMVLAAGVLFWSLRALLAAVPAVALFWPIKKIAAVFAMLGATFYCLFSGSEVATERSLIMTLVMLGAILADRPALAMRNLALSALIVLAREPEALLGPSFQMSFAAVACLIGANRVWQDWRSRHPPGEQGTATRMLAKVLFAFLAIGATTLVATLATAPFSVFHFHRLNPYGLIGNSLAIPLVSLVVMPAAVIGTLLAPLDLDGIVWRIMGEGVGGVLFVAEWVGGIENASYAFGRLSLMSFGLLVMALLLFTGFQTRLRALALVPLALVPFTSLHPPTPDILTDPDGKTALVRTQEGAYRLLGVGNPSRFTLSQWLPAVGDARPPEAPGLREQVTCDKTGCTTRIDTGLILALSLTPEALREDCRKATLIITPLPAPSGCAARRILDKSHFTRHGATHMTRGAGDLWHMSAALNPQTRRPWRRAPPTGRDAGLSRAPLALWLDGFHPPRQDGRRFFGLLPAATPDKTPGAFITPDEDMPEGAQEALRHATQETTQEKTTQETPIEDPLTAEAPVPESVQ